MIDLRSDTVTKPTPEMRRYMMNAEVGDDVYGEDPSVNELQDFAAQLFGKEDAIFVPTGSMGNQLGIKVQTEPGDEIICESQAHIFYYETAAPSIISQVQVRCIESERGEMPIDKIESCIRPGDYYFPVTKLVCLENTHNRHSGTIINIDYIRELSGFIREKGLNFHLDGARLWNAAAMTGIEFKEYGKYFDTISICLSKGLGAPAGSLLLGTKKTIEMARKWRKILGGGMRQSGILASAGLFAIKNHFQLLKNDNVNALAFSNYILQSDFINMDLSKVETNMVVFNLDKMINIDSFINGCKIENLLISSVGGNSIRAVFHFQVSETDAINAAEIVVKTSEILMGK